MLQTMQLIYLLLHNVVPFLLNFHLFEVSVPLNHLISADFQLLISKKEVEI